MNLKFSPSLQRVIVASLLTLTFPLSAALTVVGDLGGESTDTLFDAINAKPGEFTAPATVASAAPPATLSMANMLPVVTPEMTPGIVNARALNLPGMPPVFVVGNDGLSRQWLQQRSADLKRLGATGMVVNVRDFAGLDALRQLAPGIDMVPVQGGDLARRLQLTHYPVLITSAGLSQ